MVKIDAYYTQLKHRASSMLRLRYFHVTMASAFWDEIAHPTWRAITFFPLHKPPTKLLGFEQLLIQALRRWSQIHGGPTGSNLKAELKSKRQMEVPISALPPLTGSMISFDQP